MTKSPIKDAILASDIRQLFEFARYLERTLQIAYPEGEGYVRMRAGEFVEHIVDWADPDFDTDPSAEAPGKPQAAATPPSETSTQETPLADPQLETAEAMAEPPLQAEEQPFAPVYNDNPWPRTGPSDAGTPEAGEQNLNDANQDWVADAAQGDSGPGWT
ncbi:MAG: hypothetical protein ACU0DW_10900 [Shimia sp.]